MLNTTAIIKKTCWFAQNISGLIELLYARFLFSYPANAVAWFRTMMRVRLETEESKIKTFIDVKMNVIMIQPSLSSQRLTGYWQEQAAGFNTKFYLLSQAWSLRLGALWDASWEPSAGFLFSQNCDNWHFAGRPTAQLSRLTQGWVTAVSSAALHCRKLNTLSDTNQQSQSLRAVGCHI